MPLPVWGLIVGVVIGFMASPTNPLLALICGAFLALIAWAITGFSLGTDKVHEKQKNYSIVNSKHQERELVDTSDKKEQLSTSDKLWLIGGGIFVGVMLLSFVRLMVVEGPGAAFDKAPGPALIFIISAVIGWFLLAAFLQDKGATGLGKLMWNAGKIVVILFFLSVFLSKCGIDFGGGEFRPPRSL